jgi:hypothetical protein
MRTTTTARRRLLADAALVFAAHSALDPLLDRLAATPMDDGAVQGLRIWLDESYPCAAAALDRLDASSAAASPWAGQAHGRLALVGRQPCQAEGRPE